MSDDPDLFEGDEERTPSRFSQALEAAGAAPRRGRPAGAKNRKTAAFEAWYYARGFRDPLEVLGEIVSTDPLALAQVIGGKDARQKALAAIVAAAGELAPYLHGKMPVKVEVEGGQLPVLVIQAGTNQLAQVRDLAARKALSVGMPLIEGEAKKINDLEGDK